FYFFFSSRRRHTRCLSDWSSDVCSSDLILAQPLAGHRDRDFEQIARDLFDIAADVTYFGEFRGLDLQERRLRQTREAARDLGLRSEERRVGKECRCVWWQDT